MSGFKEDVSLRTLENNPLMTISRNSFLAMRQHCKNSDTIQATLQRKEQDIKDLQLKSQSAERNAILMEIKFCQLLLQISQDSSSLRTSIFMSAYQGDETDGKSPSEYTPESSDNSTILDLQPESHIREDLKETPETAQTSTVLFNKLAMELLKTKKQLLSLLQEKEDSKFNIPAMELAEYKEIVRLLEQELMTVRLQYAEIRLAAQSSNDSLSVIGALQDQIRKQHTTDEPKTDESNQSKEDNFDKRESQTATTVSSVNSRDMSQWTLSNYRQEINELRGKCQRLAELGPTWETLQKMKSSLISTDPSDHQNVIDELALVKAQLETYKKELESTKKENLDLKQRCHDFEGIFEKQSEDISMIQAENSGLKKQIQLLADKLTESDSKLKLSENKNVVLREFERRAQLPASCGREIIRVGHDLSQTDLMVDGKESFSRDTTLSGLDQETHQKPLHENRSTNDEPQSKTAESSRAGTSENVNSKGMKIPSESKGLGVRAEYKTRKLLEMTLTDNVDDGKEKSSDDKMSTRNKESIDSSQSDDTQGATALTIKSSEDTTSPRGGDHNNRH